MNDREFHEEQKRRELEYEESLQVRELRRRRAKDALKWPLSHKIVAGLVIACLALTAFAQTYHLGHRNGYAVGWSDGHCGIGLDCEAGQE